MTIRSMLGCGVGRAVAMLFIALIVCPVTAPFQIVTLTGLMNSPPASVRVSAIASAPHVSSASTDTIAAVLPREAPEMRLNLDPRATTRLERSANAAAGFLPSAFLLSTRPGRRTSLVLRV